MKGLVVIPFHNEGQVAELYSEELILTFQSSNHINVDFYLANDFSSDDTKNYLDSIKNKYNNVVIQNNKENLGHGKTVVNGYLYAIENNYQYVVQIDGDNAAEPKSIMQLVKKSIDQNLDFSLAKRINRPDKLIRKIITSILRINLNFKFGVKAYDSNVGIRFMSEKFLKSIPLDTIKNFLIPNAFITCFAYVHKFKLDEFEVLMRDNLRIERVGEQWGSGNNITYIIKLIKGSYNCFVEVNKDFLKII